MSEKSRLVTRVVAGVRALLPADWLAAAGRRFRRTATVISDYTHEQIRPGERIEQAPDLAWKAVEGAALEKHAKALKDYAGEEKERLEAELKRRTLEDKARQEKATADKMESEARIAQITEIQERIKLFDALVRFNAVPVWDEQGNMTIRKAPPDYDWDNLEYQLLKTRELPKLEIQALVVTAASAQREAGTFRRWSCGCTVIRSSVSVPPRCTQCGNEFQEVAAEEST